MLSKIIKRNLHNLSICKSVAQKPISNRFLIDLNYQVNEVDKQNELNNLQEINLANYYERDLMINEKNNQTNKVNEYEMFAYLA